MINYLWAPVSASRYTYSEHDSLVSMLVSGSLCESYGTFTLQKV